jgi:hypothetical protein
MAITIDAQLRRTGKVVRFIDGNDEPIDAPGPQPHLVRLLVQARAWWTEMLDEQLSFSELAERHSIDRGYLSKVVRLNFLAPTIVDQILSGQLSTTINARTLLRLRYFPIDWDEQQRQLRSF